MEFILIVILAICFIGFASGSCKLRYPVNIVCLLIFAFGLGHYWIPFIYPEYSKMDQIWTAGLMEKVLSIHVLFLIGFLGGLIIKGEFFLNFKLNKKLNYCNLFFENKKKYIFILACLLYLIIWFYGGAKTSYEADDFTAYFNDSRSGIARLAILTPMLISALSICSILWIKEKNKGWSVFSVIVLLFVIAGGVTAAQRLNAIIPIITLFTHFAGRYSLSKALSILLSAVVILVVFSPVAVYMRENKIRGGKWNLSQLPEIFENSKHYKKDPLQTVAERADLYYVTGKLIPYLEAADFNSWLYFKSICYAFIPRELRPEDLHPLSDNGELSGEISVVAWYTDFHWDTLGSLTAFGGIVAYREGGYIWTIINGLIFGFILRIVVVNLARGGVVAELFLGYSVVAACVKSVPASLFQFMIEWAQMIWVLISLIFVNAFVALLRSK